MFIACLGSKQRIDPDPDPDYNGDFIAGIMVGSLTAINGDCFSVQRRHGKTGVKHLHSTGVTQQRPGRNQKRQQDLAVLLVA